jgi:mono/diheme cytochrome c family protein
MRKVRLAALLFLSALAAWAGRHEPVWRYEFIPDMAHSVPYDAYAPNPVTRDGQTLQRPVPGTVPRGSVDPIEAQVAATPKALARGKKVYETFCFVCHGASGAGDGPVIPKFPNPPSYASPRVLALSDGEIFRVITHGTAVMPSYAGQIAPDDRWKAVLYVRTLQTSQASARSAHP